MFKLYALQISLIFGSVFLIGALPTIADTLSRMMPSGAYVQTFRPVSLALNASDSAANNAETSLHIPESLTQTASLDYTGE